MATAAARAFAGLLGGVPAFASLAVLLGAPIVVAQFKTLALAALLAALATVPLAVALGSDAEGWRRVVCANAPRCALPPARAATGQRGLRARLNQSTSA